MSGFGRRHAWACAPTFQVDFGAPDCTCFCGFLIQVQFRVVFDISTAIWGLHVWFSGLSLCPVDQWVCCMAANVIITLYTRAGSGSWSVDLCLSCLILLVHVICRTRQYHCSTCTWVQEGSGGWAWLGWSPVDPLAVTVSRKTPGHRDEPSCSIDGASTRARAVGARGVGTSATLFTDLPRAWPELVTQYPNSPLPSIRTKYQDAHRQSPGIKQGCGSHHT